MYDAQNRIVKKSRILTTKVIKHRKNLPHKVKEKAKTKFRPTYHKVKVVARKSRYAANLLTSREARELHMLIRSAREADSVQKWDHSIVRWRKIIDIYSSRSPVEAFAKLNQAHRELYDYGAAKNVLAEGVAAVDERSTKGKGITTQTLEDWLLLSKEKAELSIIERLEDIDTYKRSLKQYKADRQKHSKNGPKIAIVSAVSGGYDSFKPPAIIDSRFDYIVYSDTLVENPGIYDVRPLPYIDANTTRSARFVKTNIQKLLPEYDYVLWIDANIMMIGDIYPIVKKFIDSKKEFGAMLHPVRSSPYEEMAICLKKGKDDADAIRDQRECYQSQGYDSDVLIESNILLYKLKAPHIDAFMRTWWNQLDKYSRRDQFSINYSLDMNAVDWVTFMDRPNTSRNHPDFALVDHGKGNGRLRRLMVELSPEIIDPFRQPASKHQSGKIASVSAIVCVHNAYEEVEKCLSSVKKHRDSRTNLIVVDDGSDKQTADYLKRFVDEHGDWASLIRHQTAQGYTRAATAGLKASDADMSVLLNSDTIVTKNWAQKMSHALEMNQGTGIVGPMSSAASHQSVPNHKSSLDQTAVNVLPEGVTIDEMNSYCETWSADRTFPIVPLVHGFCFGIRREVIDAIGYLDHEHFPRGYGEENDYCFRAANAGFGLVIATDTYVFHAKSKSFVSDERKQLMLDGGRMFRDLHGQRRITRAVKSMDNNPYLQHMRDHANDLYIKKAIKTNDTETAVYLPSNISTLRDMRHVTLQKTLVAMNETMIDWQKLQARFAGKSIKNKVSIVVLVLNNLEMTLRCIESIIEHSSQEDYELLVVSNGSNIETLIGLRDAKMKYPDIKLINIEQNTNFALGNNIGFSFASGEYVVLLNNDTYVTDGWLGALIRPIKEKTADIVQSFLVYPEGDVQSAGVAFTDKSDFGYALYAGQPVTVSHTQKSRFLQAVTGACMAMKSSDYASLKGFDPSYINGQEDVDLCLRLRDSKAGKSKGCYVAADSVVYHDESRTPGRGKYKFENRRVFKDRWSDSIQPDDQSIYNEDGYEVVKWNADTIEGIERGVAVYIPKLQKSK